MGFHSTMDESKQMICLMAACCVLLIPVTSQRQFGQTSTFPSLGASSPSNQVAQSSAFFPPQSSSFQLGRNPSPFSPPSFQHQPRPAPFQPQRQPAQRPQAKTTGGQAGGAGGGGHTYPDGTMGGDYPAHKAAQEAAKSSESHTYKDGTTGVDYPAHKASQDLQQQQQQQQHLNGRFSNGQFAANVQPQEAGSNSGTHTYEDGTTGGNYPSHKAAQQLQQQQQQQQQSGQFSEGQLQAASFHPNGRAGSNTITHTYPDGSTGENYPAHKAAQQQQQQQLNGQFSNGQPATSFQPAVKAGSSLGTHTYEDGTTGGNYPTHKAAQDIQRQQQLQQQPNRQFCNGNVQPQEAGSSSGPQTYEDGSTGGSHPAHQAAQVLQQHQQLQQQPSRQFSNGQFTDNVQSQQADTSSGTHTYPDGSTGGNYPDHKANQDIQQQQQRNRQLSNEKFTTNFQPQQVESNRETDTYLDGTTGGNYPVHKAPQDLQQQQPNRQFSNRQLVVYGQPQQADSSSGTHTYADGRTDGNYPAHKVAQNVQQQQQLQQDASQNPVFVPQRISTFRNQQVYPPESSANQLYAPARRNADTNQRRFPEIKPRLAIQSSPNIAFSQGGPAVPRNSFDSFGLSQGSNPSSPTSFVQPGSYGDRGPSVSQGSGDQSGDQCFQYRNMADSYRLSDVLNEYPMDAIVSELNANPHLAPLVGFERLPRPHAGQRAPSPFSAFSDSALTFGGGSFGYQEEEAAVQALSNVKQFPANTDAEILSTSMRPLDKVCPSDPFTLRALTVDDVRCTVVNPDYQAVTFTKCKRRECNLCGVGQGVSACVDTYNWVSVTVYCPHWPRDTRVKVVRLYLPQGCTCNRYQC